MNFAIPNPQFTARVKVMTSKREREVMTLMTQGLTDIEIGKELFLSPYTINTHRKNMMIKFKARNSCQLIYMATKQGVI